MIKLFICFEALCLLKGSPSISTRRKTRKNQHIRSHSLVFLLILFRYLQVSDLQQSGMVSVVFLIFSSLRVHLIPLTGPNQLLDVVEQRRVQRVGVNQADQVLPVVPPEGRQLLEGVSGRRNHPPPLLPNCRTHSQSPAWPGWVWTPHGESICWPPSSFCSITQQASERQEKSD